MKKISKLLTMATLSSAMFLAQNANAGDFNLKPYIGIKGGVAIVQDEYAGSKYKKNFSAEHYSAPIVSLFAGVHTPINDFFGVRAEAEFFYHFAREYTEKFEAKIDKKGNKLKVKGRGEDKYYGGLLNAYVHLWDSSAFSPYIGGGFGFSVQKSKIKSFKVIEDGEEIDMTSFFAENESLSDRETKFIYHGTIGAQYKATDNIKLDLSTRVMRLQKETLSVEIQGGLIYQF